MLKGFKEFLLRGNIVDLAVAVVIGTAFVALVTAFTTNVVTPVIAAAGGSDPAGFGFRIREDNEATFVDLGALITAVVTFTITAAVVYFLVVVPMAKVLQRFAAPTHEVAVAVDENTVLLREIRDALSAPRDGAA